MPRVEIVGLTGIPEIEAGVELAPLILAALDRGSLSLEPTDILVVTHKIVSKAEGCEVALSSIEPSAAALAWGATHGKDPALFELVLREAVRVVRMDRGVIITETRHGFVCANSGIDTSNARPGHALTLPRDPDRSAATIRGAIETATGVAPGIIISDTFGRPWREGLVNVAIGIAGIRPFDDHRGGADVFGRPLHASILAVTDEAASAAELVMGKTRQIPVALVRGLDAAGSGRGRDLLRPPERDLFR